MSEMTQIDDAWQMAERYPEDPALRLRLYERILDTELRLLLNAAPDETGLSPRLMEIEGVSYALAFDTDLRLAEFSGDAASFAALPGRVLLAMLEEAGLGLGLNLETAPSGQLLPPGVVAWLVQRSDHTPTARDANLIRVMPPHSVPSAMLSALDAKLSKMVGLARAAYLAHAEFADGGQSPCLALTGVAPDARDAIVHAIQETLAFTEGDAPGVDVLFLSDQDPMLEKLATCALQFDLVAPAPGQGAASAFGQARKRPPRLR